MAITDEDDPFEPVENNSFDEDLGDLSDTDDDIPHCSGCGKEFDEGELDDEGLCPDCQEDYE